MKFFAAFIMFFSPLLKAQCVMPGEGGTLIFTADTAALCSGYWLIPATEYSAYLSSVEITASELTEAFTWGFGTVILLSGLAFKLGVALKIVRKL